MSDENRGDILQFHSLTFVMHSPPFPFAQTKPHTLLIAYAFNPIQLCLGGMIKNCIA